MRSSSVWEFRDSATALLRSKDPILITRRGRLAGAFFPWPEGTMPIELKRKVFSVFSEHLRLELSQRGPSEDEILAGFESWRKNRRATRRGR